jgi:hypothetical protein
MPAPTTISTDATITDFLAHVSPLLNAREAEYGLMLGLAEGLAQGRRLDPEFRPVFARVAEEIDGLKVTRAAYLQTRATNGIITHATPEEATRLAEHLLETGVASGGVVGPSDAALAFATRFTRGRSASLKLAMSSRILELRSVIAPRPAPGLSRVATHDDLAIVADWTGRFGAESLPHEPRTDAEIRRLADQKITAGEINLWEVNAQPVAMAAAGRPTRSGISISFVYTPAALRGRGYASNLVATLSRRLLESGRAFCVLYTDAANPTSNKLYEAIGYREIGTSSQYLWS